MKTKGLLLAVTLLHCFFASMAHTSAVSSASVPSAILVVQTNGVGAVTPNRNGKLLPLGARYTLTTLPSRDQLFSNWVGGAATPYTVLGTNPSYTFLMQSNLVIEANFVPNLFLTARGSYHGLFAPSGVMREQTS